MREVHSEAGSMQDSHYTGRPVGRKPPASKTFARGRVCAVEHCTTRLSTYNAEDTCWHHTEVTPTTPIVRPRTDRTA